MFNNGNGAILCSKCRIILSQGSQITDKDWNEDNRWWCIGCVPDDIPSQPVFYKSKILAVKEL